MKAPLAIVRCGEHACAVLDAVPDGRIVARGDAASSREALLLWPAAPPRRVLLVKKWRDAEARDAAVELGDWLLEELRVALFVHEDDGEDACTRFPPRFARYAPPAPTGLATPPAGAAAGDDIDVIVSLGGDGTVLHVSGLFQAAMPPVVAIAFGSLGFMTVHSLSSCTDVLARILGGGGGGAAPPTTPVAAAPAAAAHALPPEPASGGGIPVSLRMRLRVEVRRAGCAPASPAEVVHVVLNELLLERGPSPYMATLVAYVDDEPLTTVAADGLIVATQTGSTAYSLSAGGSILSPNTAAIVFTPICPHTLSFRPLLFPDSAAIRLEVPADARSSAWCSFDGRHSMELRAGDYVVVRSSPFPLPLVCRRSATGDWVRAIKCKLYWNVRERQKAFRRPPPSSAAASAELPPQPPAREEPLAAAAPPPASAAAQVPAFSPAAPAAASSSGRDHHSPPGSPQMPASRRASDVHDALPGAAAGARDLSDALDALGPLLAAQCRHVGGDDAAARATRSAGSSSPGRAASRLGGHPGGGQLGAAGELSAALLSASSHHHQHLQPRGGALAPSSTASVYSEDGFATTSARSTPQLASVHPPPFVGAESEAFELLGEQAATRPAREWRFIKPPSIAPTGGPPTTGSPAPPSSPGPPAPAPPPAALSTQRAWLGSEHALDYPDALEFDSDRLQLRGVSAAAAPARPARDGGGSS